MVTATVTAAIKNKYGIVFGGSLAADLRFLCFTEPYFGASAKRKMKTRI